MSVGPALYRTIFPSDQLGRAVGISALVVASSASAGPTIGGAILAVLPWPWLFAINVPLGAIDGALAVRALPPPLGSTHRFDVASSVLSIPAIGLFVVGLDGFARHVPALLIAGSFALSIVFAIAFVVRQARSDAPMLPLEIFAIRRFSLAAVTSLGSFVAQGLAYVSLPFLLQSVLGYSPFVSGLLITPWPLAIAVVSIVAGRLADRYSPPLLCTIGLGVLAVGLAAFALLPPHASGLDIVWRSALCGVGFGFFQSPNNRELLGSVPRRRSGAASGVLATVRVTGQTLGAALVAIMFGTSAASVVASEHAQGLAHAAIVALWSASAAAGLAALVSSLRLAPR